MTPASVVVGRRGGRVAVGTAVAGTVLIGLGAFWLSFTALADLAKRSGIDVGQAWAWPLIVDGIIVVATVSVVALAGQRGAWYPWLLLIAGAAASVTANALHAVVAADADVPGVLAASVAAVPPLVLLAITHLTVVLTRPAAVSGAAEAGTLMQTFGSSVVPVEGHEPPQPRREVDAPARMVGAVVQRRRAAAALREQGWSNKAIARDFGVHPSTVGRWFAVSTSSVSSHEEDQP